jgi:hypothetical protein
LVSLSGRRSDQSVCEAQEPEEEEEEERDLINDLKRYGRLGAEIRSSTLLPRKRWWSAADPSKKGSLLLFPPADDIIKLLQEKPIRGSKFHSTYANSHNINFLPAIFSTTSRVRDEFLCLLFLH